MFLSGVLNKVVAELVGRDRRARRRGVAKGGEATPSRLRPEGRALLRRRLSDRARSFDKIRPAPPH